MSNDWQGEIRSGDLSMVAIVRYYAPNELQIGHREGVGLSTQDWFCQPSHETNVGRLLPVHQQVLKSGYMIESGYVIVEFLLDGPLSKKLGETA